MPVDKRQQPQEQQQNGKGHRADHDQPLGARLGLARFCLARLGLAAHAEGKKRSKIILPSNFESSGYHRMEAASSVQACLSPLLVEWKVPRCAAIVPSRAESE